MRWEKEGSPLELLKPALGLDLGRGEWLFRAWAHATKYEHSLPYRKQSPQHFLLMVYSSLHHTRRLADEFKELASLRTQVLSAIIVLSKGKDITSIIDQVEYLHYQWQKLVNPAAVRPFGKTASKLEEDYERMKEFFEKSEGIQIKV